MKKLVVLLLSSLLLLCSCDPLSVIVNTDLTEIHTISSYGITVPTPKDWKALEEETEFDLYLGTKSETLFFGVFAYRDDELEEDMNPPDVFIVQNNSMLTESDKVTDIRADNMVTKDDRTLYSRICTSKEGSEEYAYYFGLVDLDGVVVWFVGSTNTTLIEYYEETFDGILEGIQLIKS